VHDLILRCEATSVAWVDNDETRLNAGLARINKLCASEIARAGFQGLKGHKLDASDEAGLATLFKASDVCLNALPYRFALQMTRLALDGDCHYLDLGGNTEIVRKQQAMHKAHANATKLCVLPDCGLMPGMGNLFTALAVKRLGDLERVAVRCGGLPQNPKPPLDYMILFSVAGLTNEYFGTSNTV
jgi:lysine 6-dehydrogenase